MTEIVVTESRPSEVLARLHESAHGEREYLFAARDADAADLVLVAWEAGEAVGYIATTDQRENGLLIWEHLVVPSHRGRGLGERLLIESVRRALPGAIVEVDPLGELDVDRVADYYQRLGFTREASNGRIWATAWDIIRSNALELVESELSDPVRNLLEGKAPGVVTVAPDSLIRQAIHALNVHRIGAVVVSSDGSRVEGILSERDIMIGLDTLGADFLDQTVGAHTTSDVLTCTTTHSIASAMRSMTELRVRHLPVTETGRLVGIVSVGDLVNYRLSKVDFSDDLGLL